MATFQTFQATGNREGLSDVLSYISPTKTPLYSSMPKKRIASTYHEWQTQSLPSATTNAAVEGAAWSAGTVTARSRTGNYTQIFRKCYTISRTQMAVAVAGVKDEYAEQKSLASLNLVRDIEYGLLNGTGNSGASGTARSLKGVRSWISTNNITGTGTGSETLSETFFNDCLQKIKDAAGDPTDAYVTGAKKRLISAFTGRSSSAVNINAGEKSVVNVVDTYISDFGAVRVHYHDLCTASEVLVLDDAKWAIPILDEYGPNEVLDNAVDGKTFGMAVELTLECKAETHNGKITQLS